MVVICQPLITGFANIQVPSLAYIPGLTYVPTLASVPAKALVPD